MVFTESIDTRDSNEAELVSIRRALFIWVGRGGEKLVIDGDLANSIKCTKGLK